LFTSLTFSTLALALALEFAFSALLFLVLKGVGRADCGVGECEFVVKVELDEVRLRWNG